MLSHAMWYIEQDNGYELTSNQNQNLCVKLKDAEQMSRMKIRRHGGKDMFPTSDALARRGRDRQMRRKEKKKGSVRKRLGLKFQNGGRPAHAKSSVFFSFRESPPYPKI
jgi:hypothetical protein